MPSCRVSECSNRSGGGVRLFSIPKRSRDVDIAKKWLKSVWDKELDDDQFALLMKEEFRVCAEHFVESDFDARGKLKPEAVPSRFPWNGGLQRAANTSRPKVVSSEHKSNGLLVGKLTRALKVAESVVDAEIKDLDRWILQLEAQVDHLRNKRDKLVQHKAELGQSLGGSPNIVTNKSESGPPRGQSSLNEAASYILNNGTNTSTNNYFLNATSSSNPGESLFLSDNNSFAAVCASAGGIDGEDLSDQHSSQLRKMKIKPVRKVADEMNDRYSNDDVPQNFMPLAPTPPESDEVLALNHASVRRERLLLQNYHHPGDPASTTAVSHAHNSLNNNRLFSARRKNLKPTRRVLDLSAAARSAVADDEIGNGKNLLPSSSSYRAAAAASPGEPIPLITEPDRGMDCDDDDDEHPTCVGPNCDLLSFSQTQ